MSTKIKNNPFSSMLFMRGFWRHAVVSWMQASERGIAPLSTYEYKRERVLNPGRIQCPLWHYTMCRHPTHSHMRDRSQQGQSS